MTNPHVLLDVDGVLLDYMKGLEGFIQHHYPHLGEPDRVDEHVFELVGRYKMSEAEVNQLLHDWHHHPSFAHLEPLPGAEVAVRTLARFHPLVCITACGSSPDTVRMRKENLKSVFGDVFEKVYCTDTFAEKVPILESYPPGYWVEDHMRNAQAGADAGHCSYLINMPYNRHQGSDDVSRVDGVVEAALLILEQTHSRFLGLHHS